MRRRTITIAVGLGFAAMTLAFRAIPWGPSNGLVRAATVPPTLTLAARDGDPAPADVGGVLARVLSCSISESGAVAYCADLEGTTATSALVFRGADGPRTLLRSGDPAPGGGQFTSFEEVDVARLAPTGRQTGEDIVLFRAKIEKGSSSEGIFLWRAGHVDPIALVGGDSPRGKIWNRLASISLTCISVNTTADIDPIYQIAYVGYTLDGHKSLVIWPSYTSDAKEVLSTGDVHYKDAIVEDFTASPSGLSLACVLHLRRDSTGRRYHKVVVIDYGLVTLGNALRDGTKFGRLGRVQQIEEPPGVIGQAGLVVTRFRDDVEALMFRDEGGDVISLATSGDRAPGLADGETLESFDAPIATRFPAGSMMVASGVTTSAGRRGLLVQAFSALLPPTEIGRAALLLDGTATLDGNEVSLANATALKVSGDGSILLQAEIDGSHAFVTLSSVAD